MTKARFNPVQVVGVFLLLGFFAYLWSVPSPAMEKYPGREKVYFWHMWSGEWQPIVERACENFNKSQEKYEVVPLAVPPADAATKFLLSSAGGHAPDLVSQWMPVKGDWADKGLLLPIEDVMTPQEKERYLNEAYPIMKKEAMYRGKLVCAVASVDVYALYVRLDHLKAMGKTLADIPTELHAFVDWSRQFDVRGADGSLKRIGFLPQYGDHYVALFNGTFGDEDHPKVDTPENLLGYQFIYDEVRKLGFGEVQRFSSSQAADAGATAPLLVGNFSFILDGQWRVKQAKDFGPQVPYAVVPMPAPKGYKGPASITNANYLMIPKAGKCPKGAWEFIKYWIGFEQPEIGAKNMREMGWVPYSPVVAKTKTYQQYLADFPQYATFIQLMESPYLATQPPGPYQAFVVDQMAKIDQSVSRGTETPEAALKRAQKAIDVEIQHQTMLSGRKR